MPNVSIENLKPGMVLAKPLTRGTIVILGEGTVLTESWISRLKDMDIEKAYIEGPSEQPIPKQEALEALDARFQYAIDKPHMRKLKNLVTEHVESLYVQ